VRVTWSKRARRELGAQHQYIAHGQPAAALRTTRRVVVAVDRLALYSYLGRPALWDARGRFRELPVASTPFVIVYVVAEANDAIVIVRMVHGAQQRGPE
jgi:plasmid stabilization system protein ParE